MRSCLAQNACSACYKRHKECIRACCHRHCECSQRHYESSTRMHRKPHSLSTRDLRETQYFANGSRRLNDRRLNSKEHQSRADRAGPTPQAEHFLGPKWMTHVISRAHARAQRERERYTHANAHAHAAVPTRALISKELGDCCSCCCTVTEY